MPDTEEIVLACPLCHAELVHPLSWFKQPYFTCSACGGGLTMAHFASLIDALEQAFEESTASMFKEKEAGCGCGGGRCGGRDV